MLSTVSADASGEVYADAPVVTDGDRLGVLFGELAELAGQRNAIDGRIVGIAARIEREGFHPGPGPSASAQWWWYQTFQPTQPQPPPDTN